MVLVAFKPLPRATRHHNATPRHATRHHRKSKTRCTYTAFAHDPFTLGPMTHPCHSPSSSSIFFLYRLPLLLPFPSHTSPSPVSQGGGAGGPSGPDRKRQGGGGRYGLERCIPRRSREVTFSGANVHFGDFCHCVNHSALGTSRPPPS